MLVKFWSMLGTIFKRILAITLNIYFQFTNSVLKQPTEWGQVFGRGNSLFHENLWHPFWLKPFSTTSRVGGGQSGYQGWRIQRSPVGPKPHSGAKRFFTKLWPIFYSILKKSKLISIMAFETMMKIYFTTFCSKMTSLNVKKIYILMIYLSF